RIAKARGNTIESEQHLEALAGDERKLQELRDSVESLTAKLLASSLEADDLKAAYLTALRR
ncbi:MAG: hypothetical protein QM755_16925, partial [Luteolibacter sp.]